MQEAAPIPADEVRAALRRVLDQGELAERPSLLQKLIDWLLPRLGARNAEILGDVLLAFFVACAITAVVVLVRRAWLSAREEGRPAAPARAPSAGGARVRELVHAARAARAAGDLRLALRHLVHALLVALGGRGDLELRPAWTNRELLRRGHATPEARALLEPLVRELEPKEFGRAEVSAEDVTRLEALLAPHLASPSRGGER